MNIVAQVTMNELRNYRDPETGKALFTNDAEGSFIYRNSCISAYLRKHICVLPYMFIFLFTRGTGYNAYAKAIEALIEAEEEQIYGKPVEITEEEWGRQRVEEEKHTKISNTKNSSNSDSSNGRAAPASGPYQSKLLQVTSRS